MFSSWSCVFFSLFFLLLLFLLARKTMEIINYICINVKTEATV